MTTRAWRRRTVDEDERAALAKLVEGIRLSEKEKDMKGSWKTTTFGAASILAAVSNAVVALTDGIPATNPDWMVVITAITAGIGLIFSRDNNVTSEAAGAK